MPSPTINRTRSWLYSMPHIGFNPDTPLSNAMRLAIHLVMRLVCACLFISVLMMLLPSLAFAEEVKKDKSILSSFSISPKKDVAIQVEKLDDLDNFRLLQPDGSILLLPNVDQFVIKDFNFDKLQDLRVTRLDKQNTQDAIYIYDEAQNKYALLELPEAVKSQMVCGGLSNTQTIKMGKESFLTSECAIGRTQNMNLDYLQYDKQGQLHLAQQYIYKNIDIPDALLPFTNLPWRATHQHILYDADGTVKTQQVSQALEPIALKVLSNGLELYPSVEKESPSLLKLRAGQSCQLLDLQNTWLELRCSQAGGKTIEGWLPWDDAVQRNKKPFIIIEAISAKLY